LHRLGARRAVGVDAVHRVRLGHRLRCGGGGEGRLGDGVGATVPVLALGEEVQPHGGTGHHDHTEHRSRDRQLLPLARPLGPIGQLTFQLALGRRSSLFVARHYHIPPVSAYVEVRVCHPGPGARSGRRIGRPDRSADRALDRATPPERGNRLDLTGRGGENWSIVTKTSSFSAPKGVPDYVPPGSAEFVAVRDGLLRAARLAGYGHIELPIFEDTELFARGVGESTDVVSTELFTFSDRSERSVPLRPAGTAGVMRAVIEHGLDRGQLPVKLSYAGPFFRYERPQKGRYRQLQQVGVEAIGVDDPALDAEVIAVADAGFRSLGLTGFRLEITSLGDETCRPQYRERLQEFLFGLDLDAETRRRAEINPLRVLDGKRPGVREMTAGAPLMLDHLSESAKNHFDRVLAHLDALGVPYVLNP